TRLISSDFEVTHMPNVFLDYFQNIILQLLQNIRSYYKQFKVSFVLKLAFSKVLVNIDSSDEETQTIYIRSRLSQVNFLDNLSEFLFSVLSELVEQTEKAENVEGSGLCFDHVDSLEINIVPIDLIHSTSGSSYIPTPSFLVNCRAILNV